jgi:hypothetical protein
MDVDTLESIYKGQGSRRSSGYTHAEMRIGLENFSRFLEPYHAKATLFMVGNDFKYTENIDPIKTMADDAHEIANHTLTHAQGFRLLSTEKKEAEIAGMENLCEQQIGRLPVGFRSPGWNMGDDALQILKRRGYLYDSSVFPTSLTPLLKMMHWITMRSRDQIERTTLGHIKYMFAPTNPYKTEINNFSKKGENGIIEFPVTVTPIFRLPFFATFLVSTGMMVFRCSFESLKLIKRPLQFQFHLSDFVDYNHPDLADQVPVDGQGLYVPNALRMPLSAKMPLFQQVMDLISKDYNFNTLAEWGKLLTGSGENN